MRILITNDDGINAEGIRALAEWALTLTDDVTVVAPKVEQSGKSHSIDFIHPLEIKRVDFLDGVRAYTVDSTPADCIRFGVCGLCERYDLVLSGINRGVNLGDDIVYSGTAGAIFEAGRLRHNAIAFSTYPDTLECAKEHLTEVYDYITENKLFDLNPLYNVNIPKTARGIKITQQGSAYFSDGFRHIEGDMYIQTGERIPDEHPDDVTRDTVAMEQEYISITPLDLSRTEMNVFKKLTENQ